MKKLSIALFVLLTGCISLDERIQASGERNGRPQHIIDAVKHDCESGESAAGMFGRTFKKDYNQYNSNKEYAQRWEDAFRQCKLEWDNSIFNVRRNNNGY